MCCMSSHTSAGQKMGTRWEQVEEATACDKAESKDEAEQRRYKVN